MPFWREYYIILFDDDHIFVIMYYEKCVVDKMTELPKTLSEYYGYGGTASKISFKAEGVVGIGMALNDIQKDSRLYSGWNRYRAWGADLTPIIAGIAGGGADSIFGREYSHHRWCYWNTYDELGQYSCLYDNYRYNCGWYFC